MARDRSGKSDNSVALRYLYTILETGLKIGGLLFGLTAVYLIWGMMNGKLVGNVTMTQQEYVGITQLIYSACNILAISGIVTIICAAARYYTEEVTGYALIVIGSLFQWAMPFAAPEATPQMASLEKYIIDQFVFVGTTALIVSMPFLLYSMLTMIRAEKILKAKAAKCVNQKKDADGGVKETSFPFKCWQMPFCREYMRDYCDAYKYKKPCWKMHSGCYCEEEMLVRALKSMGGNDAKKLDIFRSSTNKLTWIQKRRRCEQCVMYLEHQKLKYQIISPMGFIIPIGLIWAYYEPLKALMRKAMVYTYTVTDRLAIVIKTQDSGQSFIQTMSTSGTVEVVFIVVIALVAIAMTLRLLEYLIFKLGV